MLLKHIPVTAYVLDGSRLKSEIYRELCVASRGAFRSAVDFVPLREWHQKANLFARGFGHDGSV